MKGYDLSLQTSSASSGRINFRAENAQKAAEEEEAEEEGGGGGGRRRRRRRDVGGRLFLEHNLCSGVRDPACLTPGLSLETHLLFLHFMVKPY